MTSGVDRYIVISDSDRVFFRDNARMGLKAYLTDRFVDLSPDVGSDIGDAAVTHVSLNFFYGYL